MNKPIIDSATLPSGSERNLTSPRFSLHSRVPSIRMSSAHFGAAWSPADRAACGIVPESKDSMTPSASKPSASVVKNASSPTKNKFEAAAVFLKVQPVE
eukprot:7129991-Pyramimonas_sp.AAC.1